MRVVHVCQKNLLFQTFCSLSVTIPTCVFKVSPPSEFSYVIEKKIRSNPANVLGSRVRAGLAVAEETWKAQADSGAGASQCGCGTRQPHGAHPPSPGLLTAADPRPSTHSGKPMADCLLMEVLRDLVPFFLGLGMAAGAWWSPLLVQRTSGLLNWLIAKMLKIPQREWHEHPLHAAFCTQTLLFPKMISNYSSWGAPNE